MMVFLFGSTATQQSGIEWSALIHTVGSGQII